MATASASRSDAARDEREARGDVRVGGVHEMEARASDEQHEGEVKVIERMADARGEEGRGTDRFSGQPSTKSSHSSKSLRPGRC